MMQPLIVAAQRLSDALLAENEALARLDLSLAGRLVQPKQQASDAFAAAFEAATRTNAKAEGGERDRAEALAARLRELSTENRRLLVRAIDLQSRVIETIASATRPKGPGIYGARGRQQEAGPAPLSLLSRA